MTSKLIHEPRKIGELIFIVAIATLVLALGAVATRGLPGGNSNGASSVGSEPQPSPTSANPSPTAASRPTVDPAVTPDTWVPPEQYTGAEAIEPSLESAAPGDPRVTVSDVETYVANDKPFTEGAEEIVSIEFLPADVVEERIGRAPGAYGGRLLCVVELRGTFPVKVPSDVAEDLRKEGKRPVASTVTLILDARTGNLLTRSYPP